MPFNVRLKLEHDTWLTKAPRVTKWFMCTCGERAREEFFTSSEKIHIHMNSH